MQPVITTPTKNPEILSISCFVCKKSFQIKLDPLQQQKSIECPKCLGKEAIIIS